MYGTCHARSDWVGLCDVVVWRKYAFRRGWRWFEQPAGAALCLDLDRTHGQVRKVDHTNVNILKDSFLRPVPPPEEREVIAWFEQGVCAYPPPA